MPGILSSLFQVFLIYNFLNFRIIAPKYSIMSSYVLCLNIRMFANPIRTILYVLYSVI